MSVALRGSRARAPSLSGLSFKSLGERARLES